MEKGGAWKQALQSTRTWKLQEIQQVTEAIPTFQEALLLHIVVEMLPTQGLELLPLSSFLVDATNATILMVDLE